MTHNYFSDIALLITHYNRSQSLERLLYRFKDLDCSFKEIIVSDDCSLPYHVDRLKEFQKKYPFRLVEALKNSGLGNNINKGQDVVTTKYTLYIQEDFYPTDLFPEQLVKAINFMDSDDFDFVRFYAYRKYPYLEPYKDGFFNMRFKFWYFGYKKYYFYSDHPHLRRSSFFEKFGRYAEGLNPEQTEYRMMISVLQNRGKALFYYNFQSLLIQSNDIEPSTMKRIAWRRGNNPIVIFIRSLYRNVKFSFDYLFMRTKKHCKEYNS